MDEGINMPERDLCEIPWGACRVLLILGEVGCQACRLAGSQVDRTNHHVLP